MDRAYFETTKDKFGKAKPKMESPGKKITRKTKDNLEKRVGGRDEKGEEGMEGSRDVGWG